MKSSFNLINYFLNLLSLLTFLVITVLVSAELSDVSVATCHYYYAESGHYTCDLQNAFVFEEFDSFDIQGIHVKGNRNEDVLQVNVKESILYHLPNTSIFNNFKNLQRLEGQTVELNTLYQEAFDNCSKLSFLQLSKNDIAKIPTEVFTECQGLEYIFLDKNLIIDVDKDAFKKLTKLLLLSLEENQIKELHPNTFKSLESLKALYLSNNKISLLFQTTFKDSWLHFSDLIATKIECF